MRGVELVRVGGIVVVNVSMDPPQGLLGNTTSAWVSVTIGNLPKSFRPVNNVDIPIATQHDDGNRPNWFLSITPEGEVLFRERGGKINPTSQWMWGNGAYAVS